jgi:hypothetical protein
VVGATYSSPNTTVTITAGSDYALVNSAITANFFSYQANPQGFQHWFNYDATVTGATGSAGTYVETLVKQKFMISGKTLYIDIAKRIDNLGSWAGNLIVALPCAVSGGSRGGQAGGIWANTTLAPKAIAQLANTNVVTFWKTWGGAQLTFADMALYDYIELRFFVEIA